MSEPSGNGFVRESDIAHPVQLTARHLIKRSRPLYHAIVGLRAIWRGVIGLLRARRGAADHLRSTASLLAGSAIITGRPMHVTIEPTNACNLECPVCETGAAILGRMTGSMTLEEFRVIIDRIADHTNTLLFYFMGEPFLNRAAYDMIRYAKEQGVPFVTTCTNGDAVNAARLVESGIDEVHFQIGGMTQETHQVYRVNSALARVFANMRETIALKRAVHPRMMVHCGLILMKHNEHEVGEFLRTMKEWGVDAASVIDPCVRTIEQGTRFLPTDRKHWYYDPAAFERGVLKPKETLPNTCPWIYYSITIQVNGDVVPCCRDPLGTEVMGNILQEPLDAIWNGARFREFRERVHRDQGGIAICRLCSGYGVSSIR